MYQWLVLFHLVGVFSFLLAHGVSAFVIFRVPAEKDVTALRTLLNLSMRAQIVATISLVVLLIFGVWAAFVGSQWSHGWPWAALGVLVVVWGAMSGEAGRTMRGLRAAVGFAGPNKPMGQPGTPEQIAAAQVRVRPAISATIGGVGLLALLWLMVLKPF
ncbi:MAG TPA: hypothetical protein VGR57_08300 [Ktedonobacterales bacterium]|nr:hypothetical protein [Ktedonobacterales bacterium]